jgi:hypothetical protein
MKQLFLFFALLLTTITVGFSQSHKEGTLSFQAGADFGVHGTLYTSKFAGIQLEQDTSAAATTMFAFAAQYSPLTWLSGGVNFVYGSYLEDTADIGVNGNNVGAISLDIRLYPINNEKFNLYVGPEFGYSFLQINRLNPGLGGLEEVYNYSGSHFGANLGFNWYFASFMGAFMQLEYTRNGFTLNEYSIGDEPFDLTNFDVTLDTFSAGVRFGLCFKVN